MRKHSNLNMSTMPKLQYPFYIMIHPVEGYEELRWNKKGSLKLSMCIMLLWFVSAIIKTSGTGFIFNNHDPERLNIIILFLNTVVVFAVCIISNWCFCTLTDGEGKFIDIWITCSYALLPYILVSLIVTFLSNLLVRQEFIFLQYLEMLSILWSCWLAVSAIMVTHQYTLKKTMAAIFMTGVGVFIVLFICVLTLSIFQNLLIFIQTIYSEISFRI